MSSTYSTDENGRPIRQSAFIRNWREDVNARTSLIPAPLLPTKSKPHHDSDHDKINPKNASSNPYEASIALNPRFDTGPYRPQRDPPLVPFRYTSTFVDKNDGTRVLLAWCWTPVLESLLQENDPSAEEWRDTKLATSSTGFYTVILRFFTPMSSLQSRECLLSCNNDVTVGRVLASVGAEVRDWARDVRQLRDEEEWGRKKKKEKLVVFEVLGEGGTEGGWSGEDSGDDDLLLAPMGKTTKSFARNERAVRMPKEVKGRNKGKGKGKGRREVEPAVRPEW